VALENISRTVETLSHEEYSEEVWERIVELIFDEYDLK